MPGVGSGTAPQRIRRTGQGRPAAIEALEGQQAPDDLGREQLGDEARGRGRQHDRERRDDRQDDRHEEHEPAQAAEREAV